MAWLAGTLAAGAWAAPPRPSAAEIRAMKIEFLNDCCYNGSGASEQAIASLSTDKLLQYPAQRRAVEAQVPRLNQMFAGRYLAHVVVLDDWKLRILYFVKDLNAQDIARVKADPKLANVQLASSAYTADDIPMLELRFRKDMQQRTVSPQLKAAVLQSFGVQYPSLQSVNALSDAVFIQDERGRNPLLQAELESHFFGQLVAAAWNNEVLGHPRMKAYVYQPTPEQLYKLQRHPALHDVIVIPYRHSKADIERVQERLLAALGSNSASANEVLFTSLSFDYEQGKFDIGVLPGKTEAARRALLNQAEIPVDCCILREQAPLTLLAPPVHEKEIRR